MGDIETSPYFQSTSVVCNNCGAHLNVFGAADYVVCDFCGMEVRV